MGFLKVFRFRFMTRSNTNKTKKKITKTDEPKAHDEDIDAGYGTSERLYTYREEDDEWVVEKNRNKVYCTDTSTTEEQDYEPVVKGLPAKIKPALKKQKSSSLLLNDKAEDAATFDDNGTRKSKTSKASKTSTTSKATSQYDSTDEVAVDDDTIKTSRSNKSSFIGRTKPVSVFEGENIFTIKPVTSIPKGIVLRTGSSSVRAFMNELNDLTSADSIGEFFTDDAFFVPEDVDKIPMSIFKNILMMIHESIPDMGFEYEKIRQEGSTVIVQGPQFSGHHTGVPYSPMPGKFPAIPAGGTFVLVDKEDWYLEMEGNTIKTWTLVALGMCTGPMGIYEIVGGTVPRGP